MVRHALISALTALTLMAAGAANAADSDATTAKSKVHADRRGGYSYNASQTINTSGDARGRYGAADSLRDPNLDRQTNFGPFDHGFFYDTGNGPGQHGGNSPYLH